MRQTQCFIVARLKPLPLKFCKHSMRAIQPSQHPETPKHGGLRQFSASLSSHKAENALFTPVAEQDERKNGRASGFAPRSPNIPTRRSHGMSAARTLSSAICTKPRTI